MLSRGPSRRAIQRVARGGDFEALGRLIDRYGLLSAAKERGFRAVDHDRRHNVVLWAREAGYDPWLDAHCEREVVLEMVNATTGENGHRERFACRVPGTMVSARQAVAWRWRLEAHQYRPIRET
jgi:hypothetical protein